MNRLAVSLALVLAGMVVPSAEVRAGNFTVNFLKVDGTAITTPVTVTITPTGSPSVNLLGPANYSSGSTIVLANALLNPYTDKSVTLVFTQGGVTTEITGLLGIATKTQVLTIGIAVP